jgi:hypothetical protein
VIPHPRHLPPDGADAGLDVALGERAVADQRVPPRTIPVVGIPCSQHRDFHLKGLRQEAVRSLASSCCEGIFCGQLWMGQGNDRLLLHGVSTPSS